jgi:thiazole synthase
VTVVKPSILEPSIALGEHGRINGLLHCFGHKEPAVDRKTITGMLDASGTRLLPINTNTGRALIGHGEVTWLSFKDEARDRGLVPCLNVNLQTTAADAIETAERFADQTGIRLVKLEVVDLANDTWSDDEACITATAVLVERGYTVMPLISTNWHAARALGQLDVPVIRVMGSPIGSGLGVLEPETLRDICTFTGKPIILDGGIGTVAQARRALNLGCAGFLVNSCLFKHGNPAAALKRFREVT